MLLYKHSSTFYILENFYESEGFYMINLLMHAIIFFMQLFSVVTLNVVDNLAVVYGALVLATLYILIKLDGHFQICSVWQKAGLSAKALIGLGLIFNALPMIRYWFIGIFLIMLAYFITPTENSVKKAKKPSLFSKLKDVFLEECRESGMKQKIAKVTEAFSKKAKKPSNPKKEEGKKEFKNLPPI